ncbi:MAG: DUF4145 domain-containing protein [Planctomycetota bacterium]
METLLFVNVHLLIVFLAATTMTLVLMAITNQIAIKRELGAIPTRAQIVAYRASSGLILVTCAIGLCAFARVPDAGWLQVVSPILSAGGIAFFVWQGIDEYRFATTKNMLALTQYLHKLGEADASAVLARCVLEIQVKSACRQQGQAPSKRHARLRDHINMLMTRNAWPPDLAKDVDDIVKAGNSAAHKGDASDVTDIGDVPALLDKLGRVLRAKL